MAIHGVNVVIPKINKLRMTNAAEAKHLISFDLNLISKY